MWVTLLTDYGTEDEFVGVLHGVIARHAPDARVIDLAHGLARHDVRAGALALRRGLPHTPPGVHVAVVDPEVGGRRRAVALRTREEDRLLVGPDNGVLALAVARFGGVDEAVEISTSPHRLEPVSATFHGRDLFAPVAAALARGEALGDAGEPLEPGELVGLRLPQAHANGGALTTHALAGDRFGNVVLSGSTDHLSSIGLRLGDAVTIRAGQDDHDARYVRTFAEVPPGDLVLYEDAGGQLALAENRGSAWHRLDLARDDELRVGHAS